MAEDVRAVEVVDEEITALREEYAVLRAERDAHRAEAAAEAARIGALQTKVQSSAEAEETNQARVEELDREYARATGRTR